MTTPMDVDKVVSLKLFIDPRGGRVLFGEAGKDFIDLLVGLLGLPFSKVVGLLAHKRSMSDYVPKPASTANSAMAEVGFKEGAKYMVMDDLVVSPSSPAPTIAVLQKLNIDPLEEKVVRIGKKEVLELLKHAYSSTVLTSVFLGSSSACNINKRFKMEDGSSFNQVLALQAEIQELRRRDEAREVERRVEQQAVERQMTELRQMLTAIQFPPSAPPPPPPPPPPPY